MNIKKYIRIFILLFILCTTLGTTAMTNSAIMQELGLSDRIVSDTLIRFPKISKTKPISIEFNSTTNILDHIGISLFSKETKLMINPIICNFVERMMLELCMKSNIAEMKSFLSHKHIKIALNGIEFGNKSFTSIKEILEDIEIPSQFFINKSGRNFILTIEYNKNNIFKIEFPASRELIHGTDKKESDDKLSALLSNDKSHTVNPITKSVDKKDLRIVGNGPIYELPGNAFMTEALKSTTYYIDDKNKMIALYDIKYLASSLRNLFMGVTSKNPSLMITHRKYGNFTPEFKISLSDFLNKFDKEFDHYVGISRNDDGKIQCVLILHNKVYDYINMLISTIDDRDLKKLDNIPSDFYSNIPQHYIKSLF